MRIRLTTRLRFPNSIQHPNTYDFAPATNET